MGRGQKVDWTPVWQKIVRLYQDPEVSLAGLMKILKEEDGFVAWPRPSKALQQSDPQVDGPILTNRPFDVSSLTLLVERLGRCCDPAIDTQPSPDREWIESINAIETILEDHGTSEHHTKAFERFIAIVFSTTQEYRLPGLRALLGHFLGAGYSPFVHPKPAVLICKQRRCNSLAELAAFHDPIGNLWSTIIKTNVSTDNWSYGRGFLDVLLKPCPSRCHDSHPPDHAAAILAKGFSIAEPAAQAHALRSILEFRDRDIGKDMLAVFLNHSAVRDVHTGIGGIRPLRVLIESSDMYAQSFDFDMAALLLSQDLGLVTDREGREADMPHYLFVFHPGMHYLRYLEPWYLQHIRWYVNIYRGAREQEARQPVVAQAYRCVLDVVTKRLISDKVPGPKLNTYRTRLVAALRIRRRFGLPDIPINSGALIGCLSDPIVPGGGEDSIIEHETFRIDPAKDMSDAAYVAAKGLKRAAMTGKVRAFMDFSTEKNMAMAWRVECPL
ncbi:hypothetical protein LTR17_006001 [Elasticomyces elasticus]|nr:hypothetical protein LTR17_006001 [Elasticomyces elasticus]